MLGYFSNSVPHRYNINVNKDVVELFFNRSFFHLMNIFIHMNTTIITDGYLSLYNALIFFFIKPWKEADKILSSISTKTREDLDMLYT